jgi:hypothetical protein
MVGEFMAKGFEGKVQSREVVLVKNMKGQAVPYYRYKLVLEDGKPLEFLNDSLYLQKNSKVILQGVFRQIPNEKLRLFDNAVLVYSDARRGVSEKFGEKGCSDTVEGTLLERTHTYPNSTTKHIYFNYKILTNDNEIVILKAVTRVVKAGSHVEARGIVKRHLKVSGEGIHTIMIKCEFSHIEELTV